MGKLLEGAIEEAQKLADDDQEAVGAWLLAKMASGGRWNERTVEEIELLTDVRTAVAQIDSGQGISNRQAKAELRRRLTR